MERPLAWRQDSAGQQGKDRPTQVALGQRLLTWREMDLELGPCARSSLVG